MKSVILCTIALAVVAAAAHAGASKVQKDAVKEALDIYPSPFRVPSQVSELAWDRASEWIATIPDRRIEVDNKNALQTYRSFDDGNTDLTCSVKRRSLRDDVQVTAGCRINNMFSAGEARRSTAMLRRFIMTGDQACVASGERWLDAAACLLECSADGKACDLRPTDLVFPEVKGEEPMVLGGCTLDQITTMIEAGLNKEQVKAACDG